MSSDLITLYNPANAAALTPEQIEGLQKLTSAEIKELATAYPNVSMQRAYLLIVDSRQAPEKQLPSLSSFENLWNLREKNSMRHFVAFAFKGSYKAKTVTPMKARRTEVLDLSDVELMNLPGFKKSGAVELNMPVSEEMRVKVTKIKKVPVAAAKTAKAPTKKTKSK